MSMSLIASDLGVLIVSGDFPIIMRWESTAWILISIQSVINTSHNIGLQLEKSKDNR